MDTANQKNHASARVVILGEPEKVSRLAHFISNSLHCEVHAESNHDRIFDCLRTEPADALFLDTGRLPVSPAEFVGRLRNVSPGAGILLITSVDKIEEAIAGLKQGAFDYLIKP